MKLYELDWLDPAAIPSHHRMYFSSEAKARTHANATRREYDISNMTLNQVMLNTRMTEEDWLDLLNSDAPGNSEVTKTVGDFITERTKVCQWNFLD